MSAQHSPDFVTPIESPGEPVEGDIFDALGLDAAGRKAFLAELDEQQREIDKARADAMRHAHEVVVWQ